MAKKKETTNMTLPENEALRRAIEELQSQILYVARDRDSLKEELFNVYKRSFDSFIPKEKREPLF